jgi:hypothetical protein
MKLSIGLHMLEDLGCERSTITIDNYGVGIRPSSPPIWAMQSESLSNHSCYPPATTVAVDTMQTFLTVLAQARLGPKLTN